MFAHLPSLKALLAFEASARHRSFSQAAAELSLSPGAISYQVRQLETSLHTRLFHRRTRQVALTVAGQRLYHTAHKLFRELDGEIDQIAPGRNKRVITVAVSTFFATRWLSQRLGGFLNEYPDITVRLQHSVNDPDFRAENVDLAIRWGDGVAPGVCSELLFKLPMTMLCAPKLMNGKNPIRRPQDLLGYTLLCDQPGNDYWSKWFQLAGLDSLAIAAGQVIIDPNVRVQSAIDGLGLLLANPMVQPDIDAGRLFEPLDIPLHGYGYHLLYNQRVSGVHTVEIFRQWLRDQVSDFIRRQ